MPGGPRPASRRATAVRAPVSVRRGSRLAALALEGDLRVSRSARRTERATAHARGAPARMRPQVRARVAPRASLGPAAVQRLALRLIAGRGRRAAGLARQPALGRPRARSRAGGPARQAAPAQGATPGRAVRPARAAARGRAADPGRAVRAATTRAAHAADRIRNAVHTTATPKYPNSGFVCVGPASRAGAWGTTAVPTGATTRGAACSGGVCGPCGAEEEACCMGNLCNAGLACMDVEGRDTCL